MKSNSWMILALTVVAILGWTMYMIQLNENKQLKEELEFSRPIMKFLEDEGDRLLKQHREK